VLYRSEAFEPLTDQRWDEGRVREGIRAIVADTDAAMRGPKLLWPAHEWDRWRATSPMKNLYVGAAGVLWGVDALRRRGHAETRLDLPDLAARTLELFRARPDFHKGMELPHPRESALLMGEAGILLVAWRLAPAAEFADDLYHHVRTNVDNDADDVMWGTPGTLIAARAMHNWTGEDRWLEVCHESVSALLARRHGDSLWTQHLHGEEYRGLSTAHGLVGNVQALLPALDAAQRARLARETAALLARAAFVEEGLANWPYVERPQLESPDGEIRVQWCAGAPGIVIAAADYLDEELLLAGAELTWRAGPANMDKGSSICHGTAGNGYALLKAFTRTGDERWLERARRFAVHALGQVNRARAARGCGRYSLWTGDIGVALFAADCLDRRSAYPIMTSCD
jgi:lanthionine synthetase-like protein